MNTASALWGIVASEFVLFGLFWFATARLQSPEQRIGALALSAFNLFMSAGMLLLALRYRWPGLLTIPGGNIAILLAFALLWHGGSMHLLGRTRREPFVVFGLGTVVLLILYVGWPNANVRIWVFFLLISWIIARAGWLAYPALMQRGVHGQRAGRALRAVGLVVASYFVVRTVMGWGSTESMDATRDNIRSYVTAFVALWGLTLANGFLAYAVVRTLMRELERQATVDALTGLLNRRAFMESSEKVWAVWQRQKQGFALASIDVDHFKLVNDTYGHGVGDEALKLIALAVQGNARPSDEVARVGGEEIAVILANITSEEHVMHVVERIRQAVHAMAVPSAMGSARLSVSIGVALVHAKDETAQQVLRRSDQALYQAKHAGRNRVCLQRRDEDASSSAASCAEPTLIPPQ